jgi:HSP20 family protein
MTANRPRQTGPLEEASLIEVMFYGVTTARASRNGTVWTPPTDLYETDDALIAQVEIAGVQQSDISVSLFERRLVISGARADPGPLRRAYHQLEIHFGEFRTEVELPLAVDETAVDAQYSDGLLRVVLPKLRAQRIDVQE